MSISISSDHIITKFHYNPWHIGQVKSKTEGGASAPKAHPLDPPLRLTLLNYNTKIVIIACRRVQTDRSQSGKALK